MSFFPELTFFSTTSFFKIQQRKINPPPIKHFEKLKLTYHLQTHTQKNIIYILCESKMRIRSPGFNNCQITESIQNLPPELREIIYKHYLTIKLKEREVLGWNLVHNNLSVLKWSGLSIFWCV